MPHWISIVILGIIEGITEFLPVSSTGHLLIGENWMIAKHWLEAAPSELFNVVIQTGAVIAVIPLFHNRFHQFIYRWRDPAVLDYLIKIIVAFVITGIGGFIMTKKGFKLEPTVMPIAWALLIGGIVFIAVETALRKKTLGTQVTWSIALAVGFGQLIAAGFPGASRSGTTIMLALILGLNRPLATEFSFLVSIPTMLAAGGYEMFKSLHHPAKNVPPENWPMVILATIVAAIVSFIAVKWLLRYVQTHSFNSFGIYRIALAAVLFMGILGFNYPVEKNHPAEAPKVTQLQGNH